MGKVFARRGRGLLFLAGLAGLSTACSQDGSSPGAALHEAHFAALTADSTIRVRAYVDHGTARIATLRGRFPAAPAGRAAAARDFLSRHAGALGLRPDLSDLNVVRETLDIGGATVVFEQNHRGVPLFEGHLVVGFDPSGAIIHVENGYVPGLLPDTTGLVVTADDAAVLGEAALQQKRRDDASAPRLVVVKGGKGRDGHHVAWQVVMLSRQPMGEWHLFFSATDGGLVRVLNQLKSSGAACTACNPATDTGCGRVFHYSPVDLGGHTVRDTTNVDGYMTGCMLGNLTSSTNLTGTYVNTSITSARVGPPYNYLRSANQNAVDEVNAYYHVNRAKTRLTTLGFPGVMNFSINVDARDAALGDNAHYVPSGDYMEFGTGGVDDAQDNDIVSHEYGHAIQDNQVPGYGTTHEGGSAGEGFGDYWAAAMSDEIADPSLGTGCVCPYDAVAYAPYNGTLGSGCLRRVDGTLQYPQNLRMEVHDDGEIWSAALWRLRGLVGPDVSDALVIKSHTYVTSTANFINLATALISADQALYSGAHNAEIHEAMRLQGIPRSATAAAASPWTASVAFVCQTAHNYANLAYKECRFTQPGATRVRFHFSTFSTELGYDFVNISDANYLQVQSLSGRAFGGTGNGLPGYSAAVNGDTIVARFMPDDTVVAHGFTIDQVEHYTGCTTNADCNDNNACNGVEVCSAGACVAGTAPTCNDGSACTADSCVPASGCVFTPITCNDGNACNGVESCNPATGCVAGTPPVCNDGNACNGTETCNPASGCVAGTPPVCDDGNACNGVETCSPATGCVAGTPPVCNDGNACNGTETCNPASGCVAGTPPVCDDGNACNGVESCSPATGCVAGTPLVCNDGDVCNGVETCNPASGCVAGTPLACNDGDACNGVESCNPTTGCFAGTPVVCNDNDLCNGIESCNPATGVCVSGTPLACDDGNACNGVESCNATSGCVAGTPLACDDNDACNGVESCNPATGCVAGTPPVCNDGNACNGTETCNPASGCVAGTPLVCNDGDACNGVETCNPATGCVDGTPLVCDDGNICNGAETCDAAIGCVAGAPANNGDDCSDGTLCTAGATCQAGVCSSPPNCDDNNPCTADSCDAGGNCVHTNVAAETSCSDGNVCNGVEVCNGAGACVALPNSAPTCDDGNACNGTETCNPATGCVAGTPLVCNDGDACNGVESCNATTGCVPGVPLSCNDGNACNGVESCNSATGCVAGTAVVCDDGNACNGVESCDPGTGGCLSGTALACDDGNACNGAETCNAATGCVAGTPLTCDDGNACNGAESCNAATGCVAGTPLVCDDGNACNGAESCSPATGCVAGTPLVCDDGNACNGIESCDTATGCVAGAPLNCDDSNACTADSCNPATGCVNTPSCEQVIASDGLESGTWSGGTGWAAAWVRSGDTGLRTNVDGPHSGTRHARLRSNGIVTRQVNLAAWVNVRVRLWVKVNSYESSDNTTLRVSPDGVTYTTLHTFTSAVSNNTYAFYEFAVPSSMWTSGFRVRLDSNASGSSDYLYVDDIDVVGAPSQ